MHLNTAFITYLALFVDLTKLNTVTRSCLHYLTVVLGHMSGIKYYMTQCFSQKISIIKFCLIPYPVEILGYLYILL